jgi:hypothetical protein
VFISITLKQAGAIVGPYQEAGAERARATANREGLREAVGHQRQASARCLAGCRVLYDARFMRIALASVTFAFGTLAACSPAATPCPATPAAPPVPSTSASTPPPSASNPADDADLMLLLRPTSSPKPAVHVELALSATDATWTAYRIASGSADHVAGATARDAGGDIAVTVADTAPGVTITLARAPSGPLLLAYDILANADAPDDPLGVLVVEDKFRGAGEKLVALPEAIPDRKANVLLRIDGGPLSATGAASSFGVGVRRKLQIPPRALRYGSFLAGPIGMEVSDEANLGHDEGAWMGFTSFDPRASLAELAQVRTTTRDLLGADVFVPPWTYLLMSQRRPMGSYTTTPRIQSTLLQVGLGEPWSAALRLSMAQQLARYWIGGVMRLALPPGHEAEGWWFGEGVSRYVGLVVLGRLGLLSAEDQRKAVVGMLSVLATSPHRSLDNAALAQLSPDPLARATAMARGALYALRESAAIRKSTKDARSLVDVLRTIERGVEDKEDHAPIAVQAWIDAVGQDDPDATKRFEALVMKGGAPDLPSDALGPCFRAGTDDYVAFDPGFDFDATKIAADGKVVGLRDGGPAAKAGLQDGDVIESMEANEDDADVPVKLVVTRAGSKVKLHYVPRGAHGRGQTFTRVAGVPESKCGDVR